MSATTNHHVKTQHQLVEAEGQPSIGADGSAVICMEVTGDLFPASQNEPAGIEAEVRTCVDQELPFTNPVSDEKVACGCGTDMCCR
jgi:hypothetical protein